MLHTSGPTFRLGKALLVSTLLIASLGACDRISESVGDKINAKVEQSLPKPSPQQAQLATQLYQDLQQQKFQQVSQQPLHPDLNRKITQQPQFLPYLSQQIPTSPPVQEAQLSAVNKQIHGDELKLLTLTYRYVYDLEIVDFSVTFVGEEGSTTVYDLGIRKQINTQQTVPPKTPTTPTPAAAPKGIAA